MDIGVDQTTAVASGGWLTGLIALGRSWYKDLQLERRLETMDRKMDDQGEEIAANALLSAQTFVPKTDFQMSVAHIDRQFEETRRLIIDVFKNKE